jgi:trk system potassium uptake protein TrkA
MLKKWFPLPKPDQHERENHVIVVGCGRVGAGLASRLASQGVSVSVIDRVPRSFRRLVEHPLVTPIEGIGFDPDTLREAGVTRAYGFAAVTSGDNTNVLSARVARETFEVPQVIARIYDPRRAQVYQRLGITTVATVTWTTDQALRRLYPAAYGADWVSATGEVAVSEVALPATLAGTPYASLASIETLQPIAIVRGERARPLASGLVVQEGDRLIVAVLGDHDDALKRLLEGVTP